MRTCRFVDLRLGAHMVDEIEEARSKPALRTALLVLNAANSPFWTAKCDAWASSVEEGAEPIDPYEMDAEASDIALVQGRTLISCRGTSPSWLVSNVRSGGSARSQRYFVSTPARAARVELVLRRAEVEGVSGFTVTWFVEGCGSTAQHAGQRWAEALDLALAVVMDVRLMLPRPGAG